MLVIFNVLLIGAIVYIKLLIGKNDTASIATSINQIALPYTNKSVRDLNVNSKAFIIYNPQGRIIVTAKNENLRFAPASTAKIMTAIITLESLPLDKIINVQNINSVEGSKMNLINGESITVQNLLYGMMLPSGNDAAYILAQNQGGQEAFVQKMNDKAKSLGLLNTKFFDPAGYDDNNYTTAFDMARLATYAMKNKMFAKIVGTKHYVATDISGTIVHDLSNLNELLGTNGVNGIKTGFTDEAGEVLVTSVVNNNIPYIIVVLGSQDRFGDTSKILKNAIANLNLVSY